MNIKVVSLDFDGTLVYPAVKTEDIYLTVFQDYITLSEIIDKMKAFESDYLLTNPKLKSNFRSLGKFNAEERKKLYYQWNKERIQFMFPSFTNEQSMDKLEEVMELMRQNQSLKLYPDILESVNYFKNLDLSLYILSGNNRSYINTFLEQNELLDVFKDVLTPDYLQVEKKEIFSFYKRNGYSLDEILHVGDDPELDYYTPKSLGINAFWLKRKNNRYFDSSIPESQTINTLSELKEKIATSFT